LVNGSSVSKVDKKTVFLPVDLLSVLEAHEVTLLLVVVTVHLHHLLVLQLQLQLQLRELRFQG
jgi:hypothetical protein